MKYALISVSDTTGIVPLARIIKKAGYAIIVTMGTGDILKKSRVPCIPVEKFTGVATLFGGRIKTLHPRILGGILFQRKKDKQEARDKNISPIDLVVVNLYPFANQPTINNIDIGGVTLLRAAAKNHDAVTAICDPHDYQYVADEIQKNGMTSLQTRKALAAKAFSITADYDARITQEWSRNIHPLPLHPKGPLRGCPLPPGEGKWNIPLRYGENPHQQGWFCQQKGWNLLQGKPLSYCNILDADAVWSLVSDFQQPTAACVKHATPCGVASRKNIANALQCAYDADPLSAFGVVIGLNRPCSASIIRKIIDQKIFVEVIVAPMFEHSAMELLTKKPNIRAIKMQNLAYRQAGVEHRIPTRPYRSDRSNVESLRSALGGTLIQEANSYILTKKDLRCVTKKKPTAAQITDLLFSWYVAKHTLSNAIVFTKDQMTLGIGSGQTSRIDAVNLAAMKANRCNNNLFEAVMASDAFLPFSDSIERAAHLGITSIIQPGGSKRDEEVINKANELGIAMVFTNIRAFRH